MKAKKPTVISAVAVILLLIGCRPLNQRQVTMTNIPENNDANMLQKKDASFESPLDAPLKNTVSGEHMKAFLVAYDAFSQDQLIPEEKRRIENYRVEFRETRSVYYILFFAKRDVTERELDGGESKLGKDVMYTISKGDYQLKARTFYA